MATDSIGTTIRKRRQELGMTQQALAERLSVDRASIGNWESGRHFPLRYLGALESVLGISLTGAAPSETPEQKIARIEGELREIRSGMQKRSDAERDAGLDALA